MGNVVLSWGESRLLTFVPWLGFAELYYKA